MLAGRDDLHAETWSHAVAALARAQAGRAFDVEGELRVGERIMVCGLARDANVASPRKTKTALSIDPITDARHCAAYWPREAGWHTLASEGRRQRFHVAAAAASPGVHANALREATLRLVAEAPTANATSNRPIPRHPGARWPWWLAWLFASGALWWFERARIGIAKGA